MSSSNLADDTLFIQTDYSAQPVLDCQSKLSSVGHGVSVLSCWFVEESLDVVTGYVTTKNKRCGRRGCRG
jgi:hypothetical protein